MLTKTRTKWILFVLYIGAVIISFHISDIKYKSLNFSRIDYPFYLQFASKLLDHNIIKSFSINPNGYNWMFFSGTEGINNFHQSVHFEPIKYFYAVLYYFSNTPRTLFLFTSLIVFLPLIYISFVIPMDTKQQMHAVLSIAILYILYPSSLLVPSFDLRPYIFLAPFFLLSLLSITFSRPSWEIFLWFNAMFLAREEALILGIGIICYAFVKIKDRLLRRKIIISLFLAFSSWALVTFSFFVWSGYSTTLFYQLLEKIFNLTSKLNTYKPIILFAASLCGITILVITIYCWRQLSKKAFYQKILEIVSFSTIFLPLGYQFFKYELPYNLSHSRGGMAQLVFFPRYFLYFVTLLCLGIISSPYIMKNIHSRAKLIWISSLSILFLSLNIIAPQGTQKLYAKYYDEIKSAGDVWHIRDATDKYQSWILVDYNTYQAFYDYQNVYAFNRLPWQVAPGESRFYPTNRPIVQEIINDQIEYVVVSKDSYSIINDFLSAGGLIGIKLFENDKFVAIQIVRR